MGVTPSTVGTYRQRAYKKLGVSTRSEFQSLSQVGAWTAVAKRDTEMAATANAAPGHEGPRAVEPHDKMPASPMATRRRVLAAIACTAMALAVAMLVPKAFHEGSGYLDSPSGTIDTDYGELPNVVGMRADAAASKVAQAGFCPPLRGAGNRASLGESHRSQGREGRGRTWDRDLGLLLGRRIHRRLRFEGRLEGRRGLGGGDLTAHPTVCPIHGSVFVAFLANDRFATGQPSILDPQRIALLQW